MSTAQVKELREVAKSYLDHADERVVKMVYAMLEADAESEDAANALTPEQEAELDARMRKYQRGEMNFTSWEDAKARIIANRSNAV